VGMKNGPPPFRMTTRRQVDAISVSVAEPVEALAVLPRQVS
jgi:hypothetical protein